MTRDLFVLCKDRGSKRDTRGRGRDEDRRIVCGVKISGASFLEDGCTKGVREGGWRQNGGKSVPTSEGKVFC